MTLRRKRNRRARREGFVVYAPDRDEMRAIDAQLDSPDTPEAARVTIRAMRHIVLRAAHDGAEPGDPIWVPYAEMQRLIEEVFA